MYRPSPVPSVPTDAHLRQQRPVICAVDDDGHAPAVLGTAAVLAAQLAVPLTVVHSPSPDVYLVGEPRRAALERGNAFVDDLARSYVGKGGPRKRFRMPFSRCPTRVTARLTTSRSPRSRRSRRA